ncbi:hypothetical protein, partial [Xenophilus azovorans]|uniref:hypothetical protein n=1 Tax=Xenophilus azovorans TaxID=151755 RepID=UPI001B8083FE
PWKWRHLKSVIVPSVQSPPSMLKLHDFCNRAHRNIVNSIERGNPPEVKIKEEREVTVEIEPKREMAR